MDTEKGRQLALLQQLRRTNIGGQHALLDEHVGLGSLLGDDLLDLAFFVEEDTGLARIEVDGAALFPGTAQHLVDIVKVVDTAHDALETLADIAVRLAALGHHARHLGIGESGPGMHHPFVEPEATDFALFGNGHLTDHAQAIHFRVEGAQAVGQFLRQHGHDLTRKVNGGAPVPGLVVQARSGAHIVRNVGNGDIESPAVAGQRLAIDGVVEVLGVLPVDREGGHAR